MKMAACDIRTAANDKEERKFNIIVIGNILNASTFSEANSCIRALVTFLLTKRRNLSLMEFQSPEEIHSRTSARKRSH